jgi:hypothetical protein
VRNALAKFRDEFEDYLRSGKKSTELPLVAAAH